MLLDRKHSFHFCTRKESAGVSTKKSYVLLLLTLCILILGYRALEAGKVSAQADDYQMKLEASSLTAECFAAIKDLKAERQIPMDLASDINYTGMIGQAYSAITTTLGNLEAKRTSTNPNMAAVIIDMFHELGLKSGDTVAINCSGSFPSLNIATLCAVETMDLYPVLISSFGASTHGANDPELTYPDMEFYLYEKGLLSNKSNYVSIGGSHDIGTEMDAGVKDSIVARLQGLGYPFWYDADLLHNVRTRYEFYCSGREVKCLINIGGNDVSFGDSSVMVHADGGILTELTKKDHSTGLIQLFLRDHIPVIHLLNIKSLAAQYGMPIDPSPIPELGTGGAYYTYRYHKLLAIVVLMGALLPLVLWLKGRKSIYTP